MEKLYTVRKEGGLSRVLTVTKLIPADWIYVTIESEIKNGTLILKIKKIGK